MHPFLPFRSNCVWCTFKCQFRVIFEERWDFLMYLLFADSLSKIFKASATYTPTFNQCSFKQTLRKFQLTLTLEFCNKAIILIKHNNILNSEINFLNSLISQYRRQVYFHSLSFILLTMPISQARVPLHSHFVLCLSSLVSLQFYLMVIGCQTTQVVWGNGQWSFVT